MTSDITIPFHKYILDQASSFSADSNNTLLINRKQGLDRFRTLGLPDQKTEAWRNTNIQRFLKETFSLEAKHNGITRDQLRAGEIPGLDAYQAVLVNGQLQPELSTLPTNSNVTVCRLSDAASNPAFQQRFDQHPHLQDQHFAAMNTALFTDGIYLEVAAKASLDKPLHLLHVYTADHHSFIQPRHLFVVHAEGAVTVIETTLGIHPNAVTFVNSVSEVYLENNAECWHYNIQTAALNSRHITHTAAAQKADSRYHHYNFTLPHASLVRNNLSVALNGSNTETNMQGLYLATASQHVDNHTFVDHLVPHCNSNELYKGVLMDNANGVFTGKIHVHRDAQKTNAFQQNNNLLLSTKANINSQPQLEIYADDVKCSHGFTVGQFSEESLFYLRARGIGEHAAKTLLVNAFAHDITNQVGIPELQQFLTEKIGLYVTGVLNN